MAFKKASKKQAKLRMAITGSSGDGKTFTALEIATHLGGRIAVIDTEHNAASKYADEDTPTGQISPHAGLFAFDADALSDFHPQRYIDAIAEAVAGKYDVLIIDSLSHAWVGKGGALEIHDQVVAKQKTENKYTAWGPVTKIQNALIEAILTAPLHIIVTMRSKMAYVQEGKSVRKVGMEPVQRDGVEYEFDVVGSMFLDDAKDNIMSITKTRCSALNGLLISKPGKQLAHTLKSWLETGAPADAPKPATPKAPPPKVYATAQEFLNDLQPRILAARQQGHHVAEVVDALSAKALELGYGQPKTWAPEIINGWACEFRNDFFRAVMKADKELVESHDTDRIDEALAEVHPWTIQDAAQAAKLELGDKTSQTVTKREANLLCDVCLKQRIAKNGQKQPQPSAN